MAAHNNRYDVRGRGGWRWFSPSLLLQELSGTEQFFVKLDKRLSAGNTKILAKKCVYGDAFEKPAPDNVPLWMEETIPSSSSKDDSTDIEGVLATGNSSNDEDLL